MSNLPNDRLRPHARTLALGLAAFATSTLASAQGPGTPGGAQNVNPQLYRGMAAVWSAGVSLATSGSPDQIRLKPPFISSTPLAVWSAHPGVTFADYSLNAANFATTHPFRVALPTAPVEIDAISTGLSRIIRHDGSGTPQLGGAFANWMGVTVSVSSGTIGDVGSHIRRVSDAGGNVGAELYTFYMDPTAALASGFNGQTLLETTRLELGYGFMSTEDIDGFDYALGMLTFNQATVARPFFWGDRDNLFFSVSRSWAQANAGTLFYADASQTLIGEAHPGDIYQMRFNTSTSEWGLPTQYADWSELSQNIEEIDVDALDIDTLSNVIIYSTTVETEQAGQIMVRQRARPGDPNPLAYPPVPLADAAGVPIEERVNVTDNGGEVDAVCTFDPERDEISQMGGIPIDVDPTWLDPAVVVADPRAGLSVQRVSGAFPGAMYPDGLMVQVTGWGGVPEDLRSTSLVQLYGVMGGMVIPLGGPVPRAIDDDVVQTFIPYVPVPGMQPDEVRLFAQIFQASGPAAPGFPAATHAVRIGL
ncbi:MAG: hypothetical protein AAF957_03470 [Planctomycetota bacterium]